MSVAYVLLMCVLYFAFLLLGGFEIETAIKQFKKQQYFMCGWSVMLAIVFAALAIKTLFSISL